MEASTFGDPGGHRLACEPALAQPGVGEALTDELGLSRPTAENNALAREASRFPTPGGHAAYSALPKLHSAALYRQSTVPRRHPAKLREDA